MVKKIILLLIFVFLIAEASAITININIKEKFALDEEISFNYAIISEEDLEISYIVGVECLFALIPEFEEKQIGIKANLPFTEKYIYNLLNKDIETQTCKAVVKIIEPDTLAKEKNFSISGKKGFSFSLVFNKKIFVLNEEIKIDYESDIEALSITSFIIYPDNSKEKITLPATIKATQVGTYEIEITAFKEGYKTIEKKEQFGVIEKQPEIKEIFVCNINGKCEENENSQNCPQDCEIEARTLKPGEYNLKKMKSGIIFYGILICVLVISILFIVIAIVYPKRKLSS